MELEAALHVLLAGLAGQFDRDGGLRCRLESRKGGRRLPPLAGLADDAVGAPFDLPRDLDFDADTSRAAAADDDDAGGPGGSGPLLLDLADFADVARFDSNLAALGAGSIFGV